MASVSSRQNSIQDAMSGRLDQRLTVSSSKSQSLKGVQYDQPDTDTLKQQLLQQQQELAAPVHEGQPLKQPQASTNGAAQHVPEHRQAALPDAVQPQEQPKQVTGPHTLPRPEQQTWQAAPQHLLVLNDTAMFQPPAAQSIPTGPHHQAAPQVAPVAAPMARAAEADVGPGGCPLESIYTRPCIERSELVCSCPMVCAGKLTQPVPLPVSDMTFSVSCHLNYAFVHLQLVCEVPSNASVSRGTVYFFMPKAPDTTVTELRADNTTTSKVYPSQVVSVDALLGRKTRVSNANLPELGTANMSANQAKEQGQLQAEQSELLRLDFNAERGDRLLVSMQFFHPLHFDASTGDYVLQLPTDIPQECLNGADIREILKVNMTLHTGTAAAAAQSAAVAPESNYPMVPLTPQDGAVKFREFRANTARVWPQQQDLILRYQLPADNITADMQVLPSPHGGESFMLSLMPPDRDSAHARRTFPRDVVFLFDRSSSMDGNPLLRAKAALMAGLRKTLTLQDRFTVAAFNEGQQWWQESLVDATPQNLASCQRWVSEHITAEGDTDIRQPLMKALQLLRSAPPGPGAGPRLPTVFLVVDGSVKDEQDICEQAQRLIANQPVPITEVQLGVPQQQQQPQQQQPRIFTFGIGSFCNHYFLKTLAVIGRGMYRGAFNVNSIQPVMSELMDAAAMPMLTNITVIGSNMGDHYPAPIPDLCLGQPVLVAGQFMGHTPPTVSVQGLMTGHTEPQQVCVQPRRVLGTELQYVLDKIMVHHQLELMAAEAWRLCEVNKARHQQLCQKIMSLSVEHNIPVSNYTVMLSYETDKAAMDQLQGKPASDMAQHAIEHGLNLWVVGGVAAAVGVGSVAATVAGVAVGAAMAAGEFGGGCDCCTDCDGDLFELVACCGP